MESGQDCKKLRSVTKILANSTFADGSKFPPPSQAVREVLSRNFRATSLDRLQKPYADIVDVGDQFRAANDFTVNPNREPTHFQFDSNLA